MVGARGGMLEKFGPKQMRLMTITSSPERMRNMTGVVRSITEGSGSIFFLFIDHEILAAAIHYRFSG